MKLTNEIAESLEEGAQVTALMTDLHLTKGMVYTVSCVEFTSNGHAGFNLKETGRFHFAAKFFLDIFQAADVVAKHGAL